MIRHSETALVTTTVPGVDAAGRPTEGTQTTTEYPCRTEPLSAAEQTTLGNSTTDLERIKLFAKAWPEDVTAVQVRDKKWLPIGPAKHFHSGSLTRRIVQILEAV